MPEENLLLTTSISGLITDVAGHVEVWKPPLSMPGETPHNLAELCGDGIHGVQISCRQRPNLHLEMDYLSGAEK